VALAAAGIVAKTAEAPKVLRKLRRSIMGALHDIVPVNGRSKTVPIQTYESNRATWNAGGLVRGF
jgi:hypothetical protein